MKRKFILSVILALIFNSLVLINNSFSQWVQMNGPHGGEVKCIFVSGTNIFAGVNGHGVFLSANGGTNWTYAGLSGQAEILHLA